MLEVNFISENVEKVKSMLKYRADSSLIDEVVEINSVRKEFQRQTDELKTRRNIISKEIGVKKSLGDYHAADQLLKEADQLKDQITHVENAQKISEDKLKNVLAVIPNIPMDEVPEGKDETSNLEIKKYGVPGIFSFTPKSHTEILTDLNLWEPERAAKISGRGFPLLRGAGARLEMALINFMLDHNIANGAEQLWLPFAVLDQALFGTGNLPKFEEDLFKIADSDLYLNPTAEVALTNLYREEIIDSGVLPERFTAYSPSFRKEAGSYGKDTKGLIRVHQFNKVELVTICKPSESETEHQRMLQISESILQKLQLPYRIVMLSQGDMGFSAAKTFDIEVWLPSFQEYREIASISNCMDFQARRANIRYRNENKKTEFVHTLNGSSLAVGRTLVAVLENYQQEDGSVAIPEALVPYFGSTSIVSSFIH